MKNFKLLFYILPFIISGSINAQSYYNGEFIIKKVVSHYDSSLISKNYVANCNMYADSVNRNESWHSDNFGNVYFNGTGLGYNSVVKTYHDTIQRTNNEGINWLFSMGSGVIASFTASCVDTFPGLQNLNFFPDTLKKSDSLYIYFGEVTYADEIELTMFDGVLRILFPFNRKVPSNSLYIAVKSDDLSTLEGETVTLNLSLMKYEYQMHNGMRFKFEKRYSILKNLVLTN